MRRTHAAIYLGSCACAWYYCLLVDHGCVQWVHKIVELEQRLTLRNESVADVVGAVVAEVYGVKRGLAEKALVGCEWVYIESEGTKSGQPRCLVCTW